MFAITSKPVPETGTSKDITISFYDRLGFHNTHISFRNRHFDESGSSNGSTPKMA